MPHKLIEDRKKYKAAYYIKNRREICLKSAAKYKNNPMKGRLRAMIYYKNNKEKCLANMRSWRFSNLKESNLISLTWKKNNRDKFNSQLARRRSRLLMAIPRWANQQKIAEYYETADGLGMLTGKWYNVDHIVPLQSPLVCGLHTEQNLQVITRQENNKKHNNVWPGMP